MANNIKKPEEWKRKLCSKLSRLIGHEIKVENVHSDEYGWKGYIQSCSLNPNCPLIMSDENNQLHIIIADKNYKGLQEGRIRTEQFIDNSFWHYGFYRGGCDVIKAIFWKPLEGDAAEGIIDTYKIKHFFDLIFQGNFTEEVCEPDDRKNLVKLVRERIFSLFGFAVEEFMEYESDGVKKAIIMRPANKNNTVNVYLSSGTLKMFIYYPKLFDCRHYVDSANFYIRKKFTDEQIEIPNNIVNAREFCQQFWHDITWYTTNT